MNSNPQKIILNLEENKYLNWKLCLESELRNIKSNILEIDCRNLDLSCTDLLELTKIASEYNCKIVSFLSSSSKTIVSSQSLGYRSQLIIENHSNNIFKVTNKNLIRSKTHFHEGTIRSGEYLKVQGDLLILGDVNPGAIVSAEANIIIWGRLLGIAHAGSKGNSKATISAIQLRPVQLRIADKVARGPKEKPQFGLAEQAKIDSEKIVIYPLESI
tara:strand:+ start:570 stop:1217 length:648 start_codon:yes stop_codon:yes gene_type:complete